MKKVSKVLICLSILGLLTSCGGKKKTSSSSNLISIDESKVETTTVAIEVFNKAKKLIDEQSEVFVLGKGAVQAKKAGINLATQNIYAVSAKKDDSYIIESNSYSGFVKCATRAYNEGDKIKVYYGSDVSKDGSSAKWNKDKFDEYTPSSYVEAWGREISNVFNYIINEDTVLNQEFIGEQKGFKQYRLTLDPNKACEDYKRQMKTISNLPEKPKFSKAQFIFTVNDDGYLVSSTSKETYTTKYSGFTADCVGTINSSYYYGDVHIPTLQEDSKYTGKGIISVPSIDNPDISSPEDEEEEVISPLTKIITGFSQEPYDSFNATISLKNEKKKEIAKLNLNLFLDLSSLDAVKLQGEISSKDYGYNFAINFYFDLSEKVLYLKSNKIDCKYDVNSIQDTVSYVINFVNQFLKDGDKITTSFALPEINIEDLISSLQDSCKEITLLDGSFKWNLDLSSLIKGLDVSIYGAKDTYAISRIVFDDLNLKGYYLSLDCSCSALESSPIVKVEESENTADVSKTLKILDYIQSFVDSKRFALNATASKIDASGNETYSFACDGQFDIKNSSYYATFNFVDENGPQDIKVGYNGDDAYLAYQDKLKGRISKASIQDLIEYIKTLLDDEKFINEISSKFEMSNEGIQILDAIKNGELDKLSSSAVELEYNKEILSVKLDLAIFGLNGDVKIALKSDGSSFEGIDLNLLSNGEKLSINFQMGEIKDIPQYNKEEYIDFSTLPRLVKILKNTVVDNKYLKISGKAGINIPVLGDFDLGINAYTRINGFFDSFNAIVSIDVPIKTLITDDKKDFAYPSVDGYSINKVEERNSTLYIQDDYIIVKRSDKLKYSKGTFGWGGSKNVTCVSYQKYMFSELKDSYMDLIYFTLGVTKTGQNIIDKAIGDSSSSSNEEINDYSEIITSYSATSNNEGGYDYSIVTNLGALLHSKSLANLNIGISDNNETLTNISIETVISGVLDAKANLAIECSNTSLEFNSYDSFINGYTGVQEIL